MTLYARSVEGGEEIWVTCPRCYRSDKNEGAMYINSATGKFVCFRCEYKGTIAQMDDEDFDFVNKLVLEDLDLDLSKFRKPETFDHYISEYRLPDLESSPSQDSLSIPEAVSQRYFEIMANLEILNKDEYLYNFLETAIFIRLMNKVENQNLLHSLVESIAPEVYEEIKEYAFPIRYNKRRGILFFSGRGGQIYFFLRDRQPIYMTLKKSKAPMTLPDILDIDAIFTTVVVEGIWDAIAFNLMHSDNGTKAVAALGFSNLAKFASKFGKYGLSIFPDPDKDEEVRKRNLSSFLHPFYFELKVMRNKIDKKIDLWDLYILRKIDEKRR